MSTTRTKARCPVCDADVITRRNRVPFNDTYTHTLHTVCPLCWMFEDHTNARQVSAPAMTRYGFVVILWSTMGAYAVEQSVLVNRGSNEIREVYRLSEAGHAEAGAVVLTIRELNGGQGTWRVDKDRSGLLPAIDWLAENDYHTQAESARVLLGTLDGAAARPADPGHS